MTQEDKKFLDSLDDELLISLLCMRYGTTIPIWERCSKEEYFKNVSTSDKLDTKWLVDNVRYLFSGKEYRKVPIYHNHKGGILEQIKLIDKEPDDYYYEKKIGSKFVFMMGGDMIDYCQTRECMKRFFN